MGRIISLQAKLAKKSCSQHAEASPAQAQAPVTATEPEAAAAPASSLALVPASAPAVPAVEDPEYPRLQAFTRTIGAIFAPGSYVELVLVFLGLACYAFAIVLWDGRLAILGTFLISVVVHQHHQLAQHRRSLGQGHH